MELELSLSSTTRLMIRINNGSSMIETGLSITELIHNLELMLIKVKTEELFSLSQMVPKVKQDSIILKTTN
jgi:hypothetical protein